MSAADPIAVAAAIGPEHGRVVLHSGAPADVGARYSFVAAGPRRELVARGGEIDVGGEPRAAGGDLFDVLGRWAAEEREVAGAGPRPIALGYLGYDAGRALHGLAPAPVAAMPDAWFGLYDAVARFDHRRGVVEILGPEGDARARLEDALARAGAGPSRPPRLGALAADPATDEAYRRGFVRIAEYLRAGDVYQVNLARRLVAPLVEPGDPLALLARLGAAAPASYGALVETEWGAVLSASPERFLRRDPGSARLETRPIKGTRRRRGDAELDRRAAAELRADPKERAEHLMIVDLERNDLGRIARLGSVRVEDYARVVELPTVLHMVSTVACEVRPGAGVAEILRATFPGGSITGAPKRRAMEIIEECEPLARGVYTGAIGYVGAGGALDLSIAIRTAVLDRRALSLHVGGGVVADSRLERELAETEEKAAAWRAALAR